MADKKKDEQDAPHVKGATRVQNSESPVAGGRLDGPILTDEPKKDADKTSSPVPNDARPEDPPVRTTKPGVPVVAALATGAGQHEPPDPEKYDAQGRPRDDGVGS